MLLHQRVGHRFNSRVSGGALLLTIAVSATTARSGVAATAAATAPANDVCTSAVPIFGAGLYFFDNALATMDGPTDPTCSAIDRDVWYCWQSPCSGSVTLSTCGLTGVDTKLAVYADCACPPLAAQLLVCNDDDCGLQSSVTFSAAAAQSYLLRVGVSLGAVGGIGQFSISCAPGTDCNTNGTPDGIEGLTDCDSNGSPDVCELAVDCDSNMTPDACEMLADCDFNGTPDACEAPLDCNTNATRDTCESLADCDFNGTPDVCETAQDCNTDQTPDMCQLLPDCDSNGTPDACGPAGDCDTNGTQDACESPADCNSNVTPDVCESLSDCDFNGTTDICEAGPTPDCNTNDLLDMCEGLSDCDANGTLDACQAGSDCNDNGLLDQCEPGGAGDCDSNGTPDACDIASGGADCDTNSTLDACEFFADCDTNSTPDGCDAASGADCDTDGVPDVCLGFPDCDTNAVHDACDADCNGDAVVDACQISPFYDCDTNGLIDACESPVDCDTDGAPDACALLALIAADCNSNGVPDVCDDDDCDTSGVPDECELSTITDCDTNATLDACEYDCNTNGTSDACDLVSGALTDCDSNGTANLCEYAAGDMDFSGAVDGDDIPLFVNCYLTSDLSGGCVAADGNTNGTLDPTDVTIIINSLLPPLGGFCPIPILPRCVVGMDILASLDNVERDRNGGAFVQRNLTPPSKLLMRPLRIAVFPPGGQVELTASTANVVQIFDADGNEQMLPLTINMFPKTLFVSGRNLGRTELKAVYTRMGGIKCEAVVHVRVGCFPGLAGEDLRSMVPPPATDYPYFNFVQVFNTGGNLNIAIDPVRHRERVGHNYRIYVVDHKTAANWTPTVANPNNNVLTDRTGRAPAAVNMAVPVNAGAAANTGIEANIRTVPMPPHAAADFVKLYDVVFDFVDDTGALNPNGRLDPGDIIGRLTTTAAAAEVSVVRDPGAAAAGAPAIGTADYDAGRITVRQPFDGLLADKEVRLLGRFVYPDPIAANTPFVAIAHGNHSPRQRVDGGGVLRNVDDDLTSDENYRGHNDLQEFLARHGFASISVSLDDTYDVLESRDVVFGSGEIRLRGWMLLKNMEAVLGAAPPAAIPAGIRAQLVNIDRGNLHFVGHSRGGEAVVQAFKLLTQQAARPLDAASQPEALANSGGWVVRSITSISPVSFLREIAPNFPPYLLLFGTADGDVNGFSTSVRPYILYDNVNSEKMAVTVIGANHNYFNSSWPQGEAQQAKNQLFRGAVPAADDYQYVLAERVVPFGNIRLDPMTEADLVTVRNIGADLRTRVEQQTIARSYVHAMLQAYGRTRPAYVDYFARPPNRFRPPSIAAAIPMHTQYRPPAAGINLVVDDYQVANTDDASACGGVTVRNALTFFREAQLFGPGVDGEMGATGATRPLNRFTQSTRGAVIEWNGGAGPRYDQTLPAAGANAVHRDFTRHRFVSFRIAQQALAAQTAALGGAVNVTISLRDAAGGSSSIRTAVLTDIPAIYAARLTDSSQSVGLVGGNVHRRVADHVLDADTSTESFFKTIRVDPCLFLTHEPALDLTRIATIRIEFAPSARGRVGFDDLDLTSR